MRTLLRVSFITGACAMVLLAMLQQTAAVAAVLGIPLVGIIAGLGAAKWLEWGWYGRQLEAGWKAGAVACGLAGLGTLVALVFAGPHSVDALASQSHLPGTDLSPLVRDLAGLGWPGIDLVSVLATTVAGSGLAAMTTLVFAFGKSAHAVDAITQARQAALATNRSEPLSTPLPMSSYPAVGAPAGSALWPTSAQPSVLPTPADQPTIPLSGPSLPTPPGEPAPTSGRSRSTARPVEHELDDDELEALTRWAQEHAGDASGPRTPAPSTYLNSPARTPKRGRKKQQTRDWLC